MDIQELIQQGQNRIAQAERERQEKEAAREKAEQEHRQQAFEAFKADVTNHLPETVHPFIEWPDAAEFEDYSCNREVAIQAPGCTTVWKGFNRRDRQAPWEPSPYGYKVKTPDPRMYDNPPRLGWDSCDAGKDLTVALAHASEQYKRQQELEAELAMRIVEHERKLAELEQQNAEFNAEQEMAREAERQAREAKKAVKEQETQRLVAILEKDPVAAALVRIFIAVQSERDEWEGRMNGMNDGMYEMEAHYSSRLQEARDSAEKAQREAEDQQRRAYEAEEQARKLEKAAKRGW